MIFSELKAQERKRLLKLRGSFSESQVQESSQRISAQILACDAYRSAERIMGYLSFGSEISVDFVLNAALAAGKKVYVPHISSSREILCAPLFNMEEFVPDCYGIRSVSSSREFCEPANLDLILVPGVAFSRAGARLGMGGGYYDRFLPQAVKALRMGIAYEALLQKALPETDTDCRVSLLATELGVFSAS